MELNEELFLSMQNSINLVREFNEFQIFEDNMLMLNE